MMVTMLDHFLIVLPRKPEDLDEDALLEDKPRDGFDNILLDQGLPKALSIDQPAVFVTS